MKNKHKGRKNLEKHGGFRDAPDHGCVDEANGERHAGGRDKGVGRVEAGPDDEADCAVDEELDEEEIAKVGLRRQRHGHEDAGGPAGVDGAATGGDARRGEGRDLLVVLPVHHQCGKEAAEDPGGASGESVCREVQEWVARASRRGGDALREDVQRHLAPWEALPVGEADGHGRIEVAAAVLGQDVRAVSRAALGGPDRSQWSAVQGWTACLRGGCADDDGEGDSEGEAPADGEERAIRGDDIRRLWIRAGLLRTQTRGQISAAVDSGPCPVQAGAEDGGAAAATEAVAAAAKHHHHHHHHQEWGTRQGGRTRVKAAVAETPQ